MPLVETHTGSLHYNIDALTLAVKGVNRIAVRLDFLGEFGLVS